MKRLSSLFIVMPLALAVACGSGTKKPSAGSTSTPTPPAPVASSITYASYAAATDIFIYDVKTDSVRALTSDGMKTYERLPRFRTETVVSYVINDGTGSGSSLMEISTEEGAKPSPIFRPKNIGIGAYDWSPDRSLVAYLGNPRNGGVTVSTYRVADGTTAVIKRLPDSAGRGISDDDSFTVAWSPDGTKILAVHTALETPTQEGTSRYVEAPSMYVLNADGTDLASPRFGTHAIWSRDGTAVIYRELKGQHRWYRLNVSDGTQTILAIDPSAVRPALSQDGKHLAYDLRVTDSPEGVRTVGVYDLSSGTERRIISGFAQPVWLNATALAASKIRACRTAGDECGDGPPWTVDGNWSSIALADGATTELKIRNTIDSDVFYR